MASDRQGGDGLHGAQPSNPLHGGFTAPSFEREAPGSLAL